MLQYFIGVFKKRNINLRSFVFFLPLLILCFNSSRNRHHFYIYNYYLARNSIYFPFFIYSPSFFVADYFLLRLHDYAVNTKRDVFQLSRCFMYKRTSKLFLKNMLKLFTYADFNVRIHWFGYLSLGKYIEWFRYFKYFEYVKRIPNHISHSAKNMLRSRYLPDISLIIKHRLGLSRQNYIFFEGINKRDKLMYFFFKGLKSLKKTLAVSLIFWASPIFYKFIMLLFSSFNKFSFIWFTHRVWFCFRHKLPEYSTFRSLYPRFWISTIKVLQFSFNKWFFRYFLKHSQILKNGFFLFDKFIDVSWFYTVDLALFDLAHKVHYHRILMQMDKEYIKELTFFFLTLWEVFMEWCYFDWIIINNYDSSLNEFLYWISLVKYNMEELYCQIYKMPNISSQNYIKITRMQQNFIIKRIYNYKLFTLYYKSCFLQMKQKKRVLIMFINSRLNSLLLKIIFSQKLIFNALWENYFLFNSFEYVMRKKHIRNYIRYLKSVHYWYLLYRWRLI